MSEPREITYIEQIARDIWAATGEDEPWYPADEEVLWLGYAVLALAKGTATTSADVHEAWSAWATIHHNGQHRSLVPFAELPLTIQRYDDRYRDAIHQVSRQRAASKVTATGGRIGKVEVVDARPLLRTELDQWAYELTAAPHAPFLHRGRERS